MATANFDLMSEKMTQEREDTPGTEYFGSEEKLSIESHVALAEFARGTPVNATTTNQALGQPSPVLWEGEKQLVQPPYNSTLYVCGHQ